MAAIGASTMSNNSGGNDPGLVDRQASAERLRLYGGFALFSLNEELKSHSFHAVSNDKDQLIHSIRTSQPIQTIMSNGWQLLMLEVHLISDEAVATAYCDGSTEFDLTFESLN